MNSNAERISEYENGAGTALAYNSQTVNAGSPSPFAQIRTMTWRYQINFNWLYDLPYGRGRKWGSDRVALWMPSLEGGVWSGLGRWTTGFPFSISTYAFPTNYEQDSKAFLVGHVNTGTYTGREW